MWEQWEKDQRMNQTQIMSLDNEEIKITMYDIYRLARVIDCKLPRVAARIEEIVQRPGLPEDRPCQLPTKIMFVNGLSSNIRSHPFTFVSIFNVHIQIRTKIMTFLPILKIHIQIG